MKKYAPPFGRFNSKCLLDDFAAALLCSNDNWASAEIMISDRFSVVVTLTDGVYDRAIRELVKGVLLALPEMDDEVLRECEVEQRASGFLPRDYENDLVAVEIPDPNTVDLSYFGTAVNTQWDTRFIRSENGWKREV
jgi:hypothetical protein